MNQAPISYSAMVLALAKPGADIIATMTPSSVHMLHMAVGISGEAGELLDAVKKTTVYNKPLDRDNVVEELGDLEFYMEGLRQGLGISREETLNANIVKLTTGPKARYKGGVYTDAAAQARADKTPDLRLVATVATAEDPVVSTDTRDPTTRGGE